MVDLSDEKNVPNIEPVPWIVQPPSKTAICHVDYPLGDTAELYVVPITVSRQNKTEQSNPIISQKLRRKAITEYLTLHNLHDRCALKLWAQKKVTVQENADNLVWPIDELVFFAFDQVRVDSLPDEAKQGTILKNTLATIKASDGTPRNEAIHCALDFAQGKKLSAEGTDCTGYWKNVELLVRKFGPTMPSKDDSRATGFKMGTLLQEAIKRTHEKEATPARFPNFQTTIKGAEQLKILFRTTLKLDPDHRKLRAEVDLVPGIKGATDLHDLIARTFGPGSLDVGNTQLFQNVRTMLIGLAVVRKYEPGSQPGSSSLGQATGMSHDSGSMEYSPSSKGKRAALSPMSTSQRNSRATTRVGLGGSSNAERPTPSFPESVIVDLQPVSRVPAFWKDGERWTVTQYLFKTYPQLKETKLPGSPLANIGKDTWVPLEFLKTAGEAASVQQVPAVGHLIASLKGHRAKYDLAGNEGRLVEFLNGQMNGMRRRHEGMKLLVDKDIGEMNSLRFPSNETKRVDRNPVEGPKTGATIKCGIIYVRPNGMRSTDFESFAKSLVTRLDAHAALNQEQQILALDLSHTSPIACIPDVKSLLVLREDTIEEIRAFYDSKVDTIIAVVDERGRNKQEVRYIRAELQKFGNRKLGAVVLCVNRKHLEPGADQTTGLPAPLPLGILQKLNALQGDPNFVPEKLLNLETANKRLMIVGAHISHSGSAAAASCPSVAALVGSVDEALIHYTASARLQTTLNVTSWKKDWGTSELKYEVESQILDLSSMMRERIEAWKGKQGATNAPHIVFYRHSNQSNSEDVVQREIAAIEAACKVFTWDDGNTTTFDYVLVNRNAHVFSSYRNNSSEEFSPNAAHEFNIADSAGQAGYKYQYYVWDTPGKLLTGEQCKILTRHLNSNFQQKNAKLAIALPVHYAQKLAKRMYEYFLFATTNQYDQLSSVQRRLKFSDEDTYQNDREMADMMNEYLLGYGVVKAREEPQPDRKNLWLPQLDDKMFYL
ncbi:hypothetical protein J4E83_010179 [Alternaria metachromatica]|uniref:uncharacterized protein n=1 Tax=Alternaria metachromatica TaxID=283354 RepID=UPI0020C1FA87|nr:uncharacterized protein J4E83_010179 [Alternaria metachromatica]KAI4606158.1 hypothetical protein J4E83_010179 [Alternaria metachromatica]